MLFLRSGKNSSKTDDELISHYRTTKDPVIISVLFDRYSHLIFGVSMNYLKDEDESKDVVIAIFEKLPSDLLKFEIKYFSSWLHTVTKNYCLRLLEKKKYFSSNTEMIPDEAEEEQDEFIKQYLPRLGTAIDELNSEQRICITHFYLGNKSYQEISEQTGYTLLQVKSYIQNGKRNLKIILTGRKNESR
jgi:RNA polymerase sigma factor (sigma-70 family)